MSSLAHELAEQELASAAFAAASEEDASAAFAAAFDTSAAFAAASEEDASASASASYFDASAAFAVASEEDASAAFAAAFDASAAFAAASEEDARASASASVYFDASAAFAAAFLDKEAADAYEAHCRILAKIRQCAKWKASLQARNLRLEMLPGQSPARAGACRRVQARVQEHIVQAKEQGEKLLALEASAKAEALSLLSLLLEMRERAGEETRLAVEDDLDDSDGELCFEDPRQATWAGPPQDLREVTKDEAGTALRSLVRAAAGPELKFWAGVETTAGELAAVATSGAGLAKKQFKVFDPGGGLELAAATTSGAGLAKMQSKVFDPGGEM